MVAQGLTATAVTRLTISPNEHVHITAGHQGLQSSVDGGQADPLSPISQQIKVLLRGVESGLLAQDISNC